MLDFDKHIKITLLIYLFICGMLYYIKPSMMFTSNGDFKKFGMGDKRYNTIFPYWLVSTMLAFMVFYIMITCNNDYL